MKSSCGAGGEHRGVFWTQISRCFFCRARISWRGEFQESSKQLPGGSLCTSEDGYTVHKYTIYTYIFMHIYIYLYIYIYLFGPFSKVLELGSRWFPSTGGCSRWVLSIRYEVSDFFIGFSTLTRQALSVSIINFQLGDRNVRCRLKCCFGFLNRS